MVRKKIFENKNVAREFRVDELSEKQIDGYTKNYQLVSLVENGVSIKNALKRLNIKRSSRSVRDLLKRYKKYGRFGLVDRRWLRKNDTKVLTNETKKIILYYFFTYSAAGQRAIWRATCESCKVKKLPEPSESTVKKYIDSLPKPLKTFRDGGKGERKWQHEALPVVRYENTQYGNQRWQGDHAELPIWVKMKIGKNWKPFRVYITALLDAHTRTIAGYQLSRKYPDSWSIALAFRHAISKKKNSKWKNRGIPTIFQSDRGKDFVSRAIMATLANLNVIFDPDPPHYPNRKGKVERFFLTLDLGCLRLLPGHFRAIGKSKEAALKRVHELLTLNQLNQEIERWIVDEYHQRKHSTTGRKPANHWVETARLRLPADDDLNLLILKEDQERTVKNTGLTFIYKREKRIYWSPELTYHYGERVRVAYNPEDLESVILYCASTGKYICEAFDMNAEDARYSVKDVQLNRSQFRKGLKDRISEYVEEIEIEDRRMAQKEEISDLREELELEESSDLPEKDLFEDKEVQALLEEYMRIQRGEND